MIDLGDYGHPPSTRRRDYSLVLLQLAIAVLINSNAIPGDWTVNRDVVRILGIAASIFIGFRNTQAIGRWWEARTLWGSIVNVSRSWADTLRAHLNSERINRKEERQLLQLQVALVWQLNFQLRNFWHRELRELQGQLLDGLKLPRSSSLRQLGLQRAEWIRTLHRQERIDSFGRMQLMEVANACTDAIGGLERIRNTPYQRRTTCSCACSPGCSDCFFSFTFTTSGPSPEFRSVGC